MKLYFVGFLIFSFFVLISPVLAQKNISNQQVFEYIDQKLTEEGVLNKSQIDLAKDIFGNDGVRFERLKKMLQQEIPDAIIKNEIKMLTKRTKLFIKSADKRLVITDTKSLPPKIADQFEKLPEDYGIIFETKGDYTKGYIFKGRPENPDFKISFDSTLEKTGFRKALALMIRIDQQGYVEKLTSLFRPEYSKFIDIKLNPLEGNVLGETSFKTLIEIDPDATVWGCVQTSVHEICHVLEKGQGIFKEVLSTKISHEFFPTTNEFLAPQDLARLNLFVSEMKEPVTNINRFNLLMEGLWGLELSVGYSDYKDELVGIKKVVDTQSTTEFYTTSKLFGDFLEEKTPINLTKKEKLQWVIDQINQARSLKDKEKIAQLFGFDSAQALENDFKNWLEIKIRTPQIEKLANKFRVQKLYEVIMDSPKKTTNNKTRGLKLINSTKQPKPIVLKPASVGITTEIASGLLRGLDYGFIVTLPIQYHLENTQSLLTGPEARELDSREAELKAIYTCLLWNLAKADQRYNLIDLKENASETLKNWAKTLDRFLPNKEFGNNLGELSREQVEQILPRTPATIASPEGSSQATICYQDIDSLAFTFDKKTNEFSGLLSKYQEKLQNQVGPASPNSFEYKSGILNKFNYYFINPFIDLKSKIF